MSPATKKSVPGKATELRRSGRVCKPTKRYVDEVMKTMAEVPAAKKAEKVKPAKPTPKPVEVVAPKKNKRAAEDIEEPIAKKAKTVKTNGVTPAAKPKAAPKTKTVAKPKATTPKVEEKPKEIAKPAPKPKAAKPAPKPKAEKPAPAAKKHKFGPTINDIPTQVLDIYVFGEGSSGELGLGSKKVNNKKPIDVKRPRLNENLSAEKVGVVQIAVGGMHTAALTQDNRILTWGVNDQGALGRDTTWDGGLKDMKDGDADSDSDSDDDDSEMNPHESTPAEVNTKAFPEGTKFVQVVASDSATYALTEDGTVYGWGTFRSNDGILGFYPGIHIQMTPLLIPDLKKITALAAGSNHILALDIKGKVFAWGSGQQNQLGRRVVERTREAGLVPREFGLRGKMVAISCGSYHSFALDANGKVWTWGLNSFGETGVSEGTGEDNAYIMKPVVVQSLKDYNIKNIDGAGHHSIACTKEGEVLVWGRCDGGQCGVEISAIPKTDLEYDDHDTPRIIKKPTVVPGIEAVVVAAGNDNSFAVDKAGRAWSWGFSANYQTGQGTDDDVNLATVIDNTAVRGKKLVGAGAGGQFGVLTGIPS